MRSVGNIIETVFLLAILATTVLAQRVEFPAPAPGMPPLVPVDPSLLNGFSAPGATLGGAIQPFDPYTLPGNAIPGYSPYGAAPYGTTPYGTTPYPPTYPPGTVPPGTTPYPPTYPPGTVPPGSTLPYGTPVPTSTTPPPPGTVPGAYPPGTAPGTAPDTIAFGAPPTYQRLFQDTGITATYLYGDGVEDLSVTDTDFHTTLYFANCLGIENGLRVTPGFTFHWLSGPEEPDVPARLYSGYLNFNISPRFTPQLSADVDFRVGVYSTFESVTTGSLRYTGTALGVYQMNPTTSLKFGVNYLDRVKLKLLPAGGILWQPNPQTKWDIYFPKPRFANYWKTVGNKEVWWYLGGEYGGGSWTVDQGYSEEMDINDIRVYLGLECWNMDQYHLFTEVGYVFDRNLTFYRRPELSTTIDGTFMVRGGVTW